MLNIFLWLELVKQRGDTNTEESLDVLIFNVFFVVIKKVIYMSVLLNF